jgi:hypothetical protein
VEVKASRMFIGAASCKGLMEYRSSSVIRCPYNLTLGAFPMPLDASTRFARNLDWAVADQEVYMSGGLMYSYAQNIMKVTRLWSTLGQPLVPTRASNVNE